MSSRHPPGARSGPSCGCSGSRRCSDYLDFVRESVVGGDAMDQRGALRRMAGRRTTATTTWSGARRAIVDEAECLELPAAMRPLADELARHPHFRHTSDHLPATFGMVELDRLDRLPAARHAALRRDAAGAAGAGARCRRAVPLLPAARAPGPAGDGAAARRPALPVRLAPRPTFASTRRRCCGPSRSRAYHRSGRSARVGRARGRLRLELPQLVRSDRRMLLHNGYHRACALRAAGITHAPAVIRTVTRRDELALVGVAGGGRRPGLLLRARSGRRCSRTSSIRGSPRCCRCARMQKLIEVSFEYEEYDVERA